MGHHICKYLNKIFIIVGKSFPDKFTSVSVDHDIKLEQECDGIYSLQYSFDGKYLAVGCGNGTIRVRLSC